MSNAAALRAKLAAEPGAIIETVAKETGATLRDVVEALPNEMRRFAPCEDVVELEVDAGLAGLADFRLEARVRDELEIHAGHRMEAGYQCLADGRRPIAFRIRHIRRDAGDGRNADRDLRRHAIAIDVNAAAVHRVLVVAKTTDHLEPCGIIHLPLRKAAADRALAGRREHGAEALRIDLILEGIDAEGERVANRAQIEARGIMDVGPEGVDREVAIVARDGTDDATIHQQRLIGRGPGPIDVAVEVEQPIVGP